MEEQPKKRGIFRSLARGTAKVGWATTKTAAKITGATTKVAAKGGYKATKVAAKGGYITAKAGGKAAIFAIGKAYPREAGESIWKYRARMIKLGIKVSFFTGKIIAVNYGVNPQILALIPSEVLDTIGIYNTASDILDAASTTKSAYDFMAPRESVDASRIPSGLNTPPPPVPPGLNKPF